MLMTPRPDVSVKRKAQILEAAKKVFARLGFERARVDDIAEESGLSKGTLYWYFESKDAIILAIMDQMFTRELAHGRELLEAELPAKEKLLMLTQFAADDIEKMQPLMPILFEYWSLLLRRKKVKQVLSNYYKNFLEIMVPIIEGGISQGEFRQVDAISAAIAIGAVFEGTIVLWGAAPDIVDLGEHIEVGVRLVIEGIEM
jgi:AcrR family transcriptional regulator